MTMATKRLYPKKTPAQAFRAVIRFYGIALLAAMVIHFIWTRIELRKYSAAVDKLRLAGEPGTLGDLNRPPSNDPNNPVSEWRAAFHAIDPATVADETVLDDCASLKFPLTSAEREKVHALVESNRSVLEHATIASAYPEKADWAIHFMSPAIKTVFPDLKQQRTVCKLLCVAALDAHQGGDDASATRHIREVLSAERAMSRYPGIIGHLTSEGFGRMANSLVERISPDMAIESSGDESGRLPSSRQVSGVCEELLNESWRCEAVHYAYATARVVDADTWMSEAGLDTVNVDPSKPDGRSDSLPGRLWHYALRPVIYATGRDVLNVDGVIVALSQTPNWPAFEASRSQFPDPGRFHFFAKLYVDFCVTGWELQMEFEYRDLAGHRMAALQLALRLYAHDHEGRFPAELTALVPAYLPAVPLDPMTTGQMLRYRSGSDPIIYSVGKDGVDDGGNDFSTDPKVIDNPWEQKDYVIHLNRKPRIIRPRSEGVYYLPASTQP
jgi:hypothetical protein